MSCYCGSDKTYETCCAPYVNGTLPAQHAETLMRARYCAYVLGRGEFLVATTVPARQVPEDADLITAHAKNTSWLKLDILRSVEADSEASVEFKAYYKEADGVMRVHHELSTFLKMEGRWYYDAGELYHASIGRNESCPCGSGKKYKKCCGSAV